MSDYLIRIATDNTAFDGTPEIEIARILRKLAARIERNCDADRTIELLDINGNNVGYAEYE